jgi:hypothetical protein
MRTNAMSVFGRMSHSVHLMFYPAALAGYYFVYAPHSAAKAELAKQEEWDNMVKKRSVDPDLFNPFTPIPFHGSIQSHYGLANLNMRGFVNQNNHINEATYVWKGMHDSYDHGNKRTHLYNWTSVNV